MLRFLYQRTKSLVQRETAGDPDFPNPSEMRELLEQVPKWKVEAFNNFRHKSKSQIGVIHTLTLEPIVPAKTIAMIVLAEKMQHLGLLNTKAFFDDVKRCPLVRVSSFGHGSSAEENLWYMAFQVTAAVRDILPTEIRPKWMVEKDSAEYQYAIVKRERFTEALLSILEGAYTAIQKTKFPYQKKEKMICLVAGMEQAISQETTQMANRFLGILKDIFIKYGKGKIVFVGDGNLPAITSIDVQGYGWEIERIYDDDAGEDNYRNV